MKNTHTISTEFVSNIYITSDDEIKEGDWFITNNNEIIKCLKNKEEQCFYTPLASILSKFCKKIILTTDQDLIKDGVQAINDYQIEIGKELKKLYNETNRTR